jgi:hypothetical protein
MVISDISNNWKQLTVCIILLLLILLWDLILFNNKKKIWKQKKLNSIYTSRRYLLGFASIITDDIDKHNMQMIHLKMNSASIQCLEKINQAIIEKKLSVPFLPPYSHLSAL